MSNLTRLKWEQFKAKGKERTELHHPLEKGLYYIKLAKGGSWRLRMRVNDKRITRTIPDSSEIPPLEALEKARALKEQLRAPNSNSLTPIKTQTFFDDVYTPHMKRISETGKETLAIIKNNFEHLFNKNLTDITVDDIREWERKRKASRSTLKRDLGAFKAMLNFAAGQKSGDPNDKPVIAENPIKHVVLSRMSAEQRKKKQQDEERLNLKRDLLGEEERRKIQNALSEYDLLKRQQRASSIKHGKPNLRNLSTVNYAHWFTPFCHIARLTGMRPADIRRLRWDSIKTDERNGIEVLKFTPSKTAHHSDPIEVTFPIKAELKEALDKCREDRVSDSQLIFPSERVNGIMDKNAYQTHWTKVKKMAGVSAEIDFYCFRHNFISDLVTRGLPLLVIARLVGHKTTDMIAKNYYKQDLDDLARYF